MKTIRLAALIALPLLTTPAAAQLAPDTKTTATATVRMNQCRAELRAAKPGEDVFTKSGECVRDCAGHTIYGNAHTWDMCTLSFKKFQAARALAAAGVPQKSESSGRRLE